MKRIRTLGAYLMAAFVIGGIAATAASATEYPLTGLPEIGRCKKVDVGGAYSSNGCIKVAPEHNGRFEWFPGPGDKGKFEASAIGEAKLETVNKVRIGCGPSEMIGQVLDGKKVAVTLNLHGCLQIGTNQPCSTVAFPNPSSEIVIKAEGEVGFISGKGGEKPKVGLDLVFTEDTWTCGPAKEPLADETWTLEGSAIGAIKPIDRMKTEYKMIYTGLGGKQVPEKFEEGVKDTPIVKRMIGVETKTEDAGLTLREERKTILAEVEEPLEIKAK
jgi:hypothetical protein